MKTGKTSTGFAWEIDESIAEDIEFMDLLADAREDGFLMGRVIKALLGEEQQKALYDHCRNEKGRVPMEVVGKEFEEIFNADGELKNS